MDPDATDEVIAIASAAAREHLAGIATRPVRPPGAQAAVDAIDVAFPEEGIGAAAAVRLLAHHGAGAAIGTPGPRFFHFVTGGTTPAALGADWLTTAYDQHAFAPVGSPLAARIETIALAWMKELLGLPASLDGVIVTGATMANVVGLTAARQWWGEQHGVDVSAAGLAGLPPVPVFTSGYVHSTIPRAAATLGLGRDQVRVLARDDAGRLDRDALVDALDALGGAPAIVVANAGEVNTGDFDPIAEMVEIGHARNAWVHVDGAFGLFARASPDLADRAEGAAGADSLTVDGHKWLNVPFDCGFSFVRDGRLLSAAFAAGAAYLPEAGEGDPIYGFLGPEMSRRARSFAVYTTLAAYGRAGYRALVERNVGHAARLAAQIEAADDFELLAPVRLNIVCFRHRPLGMDGVALDAHNAALGARLLADGRIFAGTTTYRGMTAFRPAFVNWRTADADVDEILPTLRELAQQG
ncbi:MAG: aspartate aminotransferase family protein [Solirubrobacteraceae bacterium]|nr:aspartate aminotransferase family protein [Solirubrobacteraceae bacterium]